MIPFIILFTNGLSCLHYHKTVDEILAKASFFLYSLACIFRTRIADFRAPERHPTYDIQPGPYEEDMPRVGHVAR